MSEKKTVYAGPSFLSFMIVLQLIMLVLKYAGVLASAPLWAVWLPSLIFGVGLALVLGAVVLFVLFAAAVAAAEAYSTKK